MRERYHQADRPDPGRDETRDAEIRPPDAPSINSAVCDVQKSGRAEHGRVLTGQAEN